LAAFDLYLRALHHVNHFDRSSLIRGLGLLEQAIERDPDYGPALALAAHCHQRIEVMSRTDDPETARRTSIAFARRALRNSPNDPEVLRIAAFVPGYFGEDIDVSLRLIDRCLALNPSYARGWYPSGLLRVFAGQPDLALHPRVQRPHPLPPCSVRHTGAPLAPGFDRDLREAPLPAARGLGRWRAGSRNARAVDQRRPFFCVA
jgi:adenylate cyclase